MYDFKGKNVIITGSTKGIGKSIATEYAKSGANIIINGQNEELLKEVCEEIKSYEVKCEFYKANVSKYEEAQNFIEFAMEKFNKIDILINNAGITRDCLVLRMTEEQWDEVMNVNLKGAFNCIKFTIRNMLKGRSGSIVNITSIVGQMGNIGQANYCASKAGLIGLTKSIAREFASKNITCNAVAPGFIDTDMTRNIKEEIKNQYLKNIPLNRLGTVEEVANAVLFLTQNAYITGHVLNIDGGVNM